MDYKPKIKIIHISLSTSKETTSEKFLIYNLQIITSKFHRLWLLSHIQISNALVAVHGRSSSEG